MSVLGVIARPRANAGGSLRAAVERSPGVEVALEALDGRLVLVIEDSSQQSAVAAMADLAAHPDVLNVSLVYEYSGDEAQQGSDPLDDNIAARSAARSPAAHSIVSR